MSNEIIKKQVNQIHSGVRGLLSKPGEYNPDKTNAKRERFLGLLEKKYGYTNDKAIDELERLLKHFYRTNKSLGIHPHAVPRSHKNTEEKR